MGVEVFLDANVLVYAVSKNPEEARKQARAEAILAGIEFGVSGQVLAEFYVTTTRKIERKLTPEEALGVIARLTAVAPVVPVDTALGTSGAHLSSQFQISYWDGAVIAAAQRLGASVVYSEDLSHGQRYGSVMVLNPFLLE